MRHALARGRPHVRHIKVGSAAVTRIAPARAHARAYVFDPRLLRRGAKRAVAIAAIKVVATEIVYHVKVRQLALAGMAPRARKAVPVIIRTEPGGLGAVGECAVALVMQQKVRRPVPRVEVGRGIVILVKPQVVAVQAQVDVEPAVPVVISNRRVGKVPCGGCAN